MFELKIFGSVKILSNIVFFSKWICLTFFWENECPSWLLFVNFKHLKRLVVCLPMLWIMQTFWRKNIPEIQTLFTVQGQFDRLTKVWITHFAVELDSRYHEKMISPWQFVLIEEKQQHTPLKGSFQRVRLDGYTHLISCAELVVTMEGGEC